MALKHIQTQEQKLAQQQRLTQQQMLQVKLLEMPLAQLEQNVQMEVDDNPALESTNPNDGYDDNMETSDSIGNNDESEEDEREREDRQDALDDALSRMCSDDELTPTGAYSGDGYQTAETEEMVWGDPTSFYDKLKEQMGEEDLSEQQIEILKYLIGSLDSDGLLRKDLDNISDELAIYHNIDAEKSEIEEVLYVLQSFDPAGIGARSLQECLLLQIRRQNPSPTRDLAERVINEYYNEFIRKHWAYIAQQMNISEETMEAVRSKILRLNPKPGAAMSETEGSHQQQITPDFIVEVADNGDVSFALNKGRVPELYISESFTDLLKSYQMNKQMMNRRDKEALLYAREKVDRAQSYIDAIKQRRRTLYVTMSTIIQLQKRYFQSGDENDLRPMVLKDVAEKTKLDISTISRVCNAKYAQLPWGTFRLRHFFSEGVLTKDGEQLSNRQLQAALKEVVNSEDKRHPLSDDALSKEMKRRGFPIARRTVAKYREQMGIPSARLRK